MYVYIHIYVYVYVYTYIYTYVCVCIFKVAQVKRELIPFMVDSLCKDLEVGDGIGIQTALIR